MTSLPRAAGGGAPPTRPRLALGALALGGFGIGTTEFATMGLLPEVATDLGVDIPTAGHAITAYAVGVVLGAPTLAALGARLDRRTLLLLLMAAFTVGNVLSAFAPTMPALIAARLVAGLPHGAFFGVGAVMGTAVVGPERRGRAVAAMMTGLTVACAVGVPLTAVVGHATGWRWAFVGVGAIGLATLVALHRWIPSLPSDPAAGVRRELGAVRNRQLGIAFAAGAVGFGGMFAVYSYVKPLLTDVTGLDVGVVPLVLALYGVGMTAGTLIGGRLADRSVLGTVVAGMVATIVVLVVIGLVGAYPVARRHRDRAARCHVAGAGPVAADPPHGRLARRTVARCGAVPLGAQPRQRRRRVPRRPGDRGRLGAARPGVGRGRTHRRRPADRPDPRSHAAARRASRARHPGVSDGGACRRSCG